MGGSDPQGQTHQQAIDKGELSKERPATKCQVGSLCVEEKPAPELGQEHAEQPGRQEQRGLVHCRGKDGSEVCPGQGSPNSNDRVLPFVDQRGDVGGQQAAGKDCQGGEKDTQPGKEATGEDRPLPRHGHQEVCLVWRRAWHGHSSAVVHGLMLAAAPPLGKEHLYLLCTLAEVEVDATRCGLVLPLILAA